MKAPAAGRRKWRNGGKPVNTLTLSYDGQSERTWPTRTREFLMLAAVWYERARQRQRLEQLPEWQLEDIGISRSEALREAAKPFWQP
jgi:uncharacterized protein YjiS (DUF1127 family)